MKLKEVEEKIRAIEKQMKEILSKNNRQTNDEWLSLRAELRKLFFQKVVLTKNDFER